MISLIWAMDENRVIGKNNQLPWHLPADLQFFKRTTMGHPIAMGRKTHESIGKPLPGRENIIVTRNKDYSSPGCTVLHSIDDLISFSKEQNQEIFIIGGAEIFKSAFSHADRLYITKIKHSFAGDTFFPEINMDEWTLVFNEKGKVDEKNSYEHEFFIYDRKR